MAVFSRMGLNISQPEQPPGEIKFCVFGLMLSTDSPKLLLLSVTCGVLSVTLLSTASRALLAALWNRSRQWLIKFLTNDDDAQLKPVPMGNVHTVPAVSGVQMDTNPTAHADLWATYEIIDLPRIRPRVCDAQTSPLHAGSLVHCVATEDRACSPCPMYGAASEEEDLLVFETEGDREMREGDADESLVSFDRNPEHDELHDRLMSLEKALQETHREMGQHMSSLSELSQRHFCSANTTSSSQPSSTYNFPPSSYQIHACHLHPLLTSSADPANGLVWEDEFTPERQTSLHPDLQDLELWQSDLRFYSGLCGNHEVESGETSLISETSDSVAGRTPRDSGVMELWDVESEEEREEERKENVEEKRVCVRCAGAIEHPRTQQRPVSAPAHGDAGVVSSGVGCLSSGCSPLHQPATDRVPKRKVGKK